MKLIIFKYYQLMVMELISWNSVSSSTAADGISTGYRSRYMATSSGDITDAQGSNNDIIFKGTDDGADITAFTLDMSI